MVGTGAEGHSVWGGFGGRWGGGRGERFGQVPAFLEKFRWRAHDAGSAFSHRLGGYDDFVRAQSVTYGNVQGSSNG